MKMSDLYPMQNAEMIAAAEDLEDGGWTVVGTGAGGRDMIEAWRTEPTPIRLRIAGTRLIEVALWSSLIFNGSPDIISIGIGVGSTIKMVFRKKEWIDRFVAGLGQRCVVTHSIVHVGHRTKFNVISTSDTSTIKIVPLAKTGGSLQDEIRLFSYDDRGADAAARRFRGYAPPR